MRYLLTVVALGLCTASFAESTVSSSSNVNASSSTSVTSSITSNDSSSVTQSVVGETGSSTSSIVGRTGSMCTAVVDSKRCEISCQAPKVAQCGKALNAAGPACICK